MREVRPRRANRSTSIIVNQCICKCLPQRWQTHSFAKLTTFLYSLDFFNLFSMGFVILSAHLTGIILPHLSPSPLKHQAEDWLYSLLAPLALHQADLGCPTGPFLVAGAAPNYGESSLSPLPGKYHDFCLISLRSALRRWLRARL